MKSSSCLFAAMLFSVVAISVTKADCGDPPSIPNATNNVTGTSPYPQDTTIRYDCELGYNPVGTSRFYTCTGKTWTDGNFRCEQIYCSHVETPENGRVENTPTYEVGTIIQFACNEGYAMSGQNKMLCRIDGEWLPSTPPICTAKDCGEFGSIQDADLFQDNSYIERNHYGSVVEVTCLDGTTPIGPSQVKCQANGEWGLRPTCEDVPCPPYPNTDSPCISELQTFGVYLFINCKENVATHFGPNAAECISGQWDTTEMGCLCDCILPEYNSSSLTLNGLNGHGNLPHATMLDWTCHDTSDKSSLKLVMCLDGKFNIQDDQDNDIIYSNPSDFTRIILPQLCNLPPLVSLSSLSSQPSTTTSTTSNIWSKPETKSSQSKTLHSSMSSQVTVSPQSIMLSSTMSTPVTASSQSITPSSTISSPVTASSQSIMPLSTISSPVTASSKSITPSSTMSTTLTVSSQSITQSSTMSTSVTASSQSITPSQSTMPSSTMSTPVTVSSQSITPSSTMSTPETASSQSITPSQSTTPSSTMSTPVTVSSQSITPSSTMSTHVTASSQSITPSQSTMPSSTMSTPVTVSSQSITPSSTLSTS
ncbi:uncharacterized protein LOC132722975 [Ruditapes philippinarum]|uniref:uncharacterized protein LOC132722975 n=1 Tax=Ruditapes philippinarum TaxID=129788 RepID=UPI00295A8E93|nr:uncharacterized protein LOC132722975 [Ruditapes philippinarum]